MPLIEEKRSTLAALATAMYIRHFQLYTITQFNTKDRNAHNS